MTSGDDLFRVTPRPCGARRAAPALKMPAPFLIYLLSLLRCASLCRFAVPATRPVHATPNDLCLSRKVVPPASPCHSFRPRCPTGHHHGKMPRNTPVSLQGKPCGQTRRKTRPYHGHTHGHTTAKPPTIPPTNPRPTHDQPPAANPFRVTPRPYMARRAAPALKMPVSIFTYTFVFPRRCIFSTVGSRRLFGDQSAGRDMASPDRPTARPTRRNRAGGGNVQEKDALRGAQYTKEDAYGDDERGA